MLDALERESPFPGAARVGVTGAPGAGKSTLLDALVRVLRARDETVAIVAVDPSSRQTGGALLGDRIRMRSVGADPGVFIRSMAARDQLGGVAAGVRAAIAILGASFDCILVETVGVGQSESEVASLVDSLVFVANPGSGDALQFMKAGLLEWPDVFVVNKADVGPPATRTASELESALALGPRDSAAWQPPVLMLSARDGSGIDALVDALDAHRRHLIDSDELRARRAAGRDAHVVESLARRYGSHGLEQLGGARAVAERVREDAAHSTFAWVDVLGREIEDALRKPV
jgi:LAO/AO transport system kinase